MTVSSDSRRGVLSGPVVGDLMDPQVICLGASASFKELVVALLRHEAPAVIVVDDSTGAAMGIVTEADLLVRQAFGGLPAGDMALRWDNNDSLARVAVHHLGLQAWQIMSAPLISISPDADELEAARVLAGNGLRILPVMSDGTVVGMLSRRAILARLDHPDVHLQARIEQCLDRLVEAGEVHVDVDQGVVSLTGHRGGRRCAYEIEREVAALEGVIEVVWRDEVGEVGVQVPPLGPTA